MAGSSKPKATCERCRARPAVDRIAIGPRAGGQGFDFDYGLCVVCVVQCLIWVQEVETAERRAELDAARSRWRSGSGQAPEGEDRLRSLLEESRAIAREIDAEVWRHVEAGRSAQSPTVAEALASLKAKRRTVAEILAGPTEPAATPTVEGVAADAPAATKPAR